MECLQCLQCLQELPENHSKFCSLNCANLYSRKPRHERICSCGKVEYVATHAQLARKCRSCSKMGNTSSKNMSQESRDKISASKLGATPWNKGKTEIYTDAARKSMGAKHLGKTLNNEHRASISKGLTKAYLVNPSKLKGVALTDSHKSKITHTLSSHSDAYKAELNEQRSKTMTEIRKNMTDEQLSQQSNRVSQSLTKFTNHDIYVKLKEYKLEPLFELPDNDDIFTIPVIRRLRCRCGRSWEIYLYEILKGRTRSCGCVKSYVEIELYNYVTQDLAIPELGVVTNTRPDFMNGLELDIYIPEYSIAIEYHGLVHHSERPVFGPKDLRKVKTQHETKYLLCKKAGVKLIQIFEDEWINKPVLIQNMIKSRLGLTQHKVFARKTEVINIAKDAAAMFFNSNHISGNTGSIKEFGLKSESGELLAAISLRRTWNKSYGNVIEIARFASKQDYQIIGGFSKLLKHAIGWAKLEGFESILTYADCRFGSGEVYNKAGFAQMLKTKPNYFYERYGIRESRFKHRKSPKLQGNTEREQQNNLDWYAIYDAGNEVYIKVL